jgi:hypothetical protein
VAGLYSRSAELIGSLQGALARGEPLLDLAPKLMESGLALMAQASSALDRATTTLDRCDAVLGRVERLLVGGDALSEQLLRNARLEQRRLELEIARLEGLAKSSG